MVRWWQRQKHAQDKKYNHRQETQISSSSLEEWIINKLWILVFQGRIKNKKTKQNTYLWLLQEAELKCKESTIELRAQSQIKISKGYFIERTGRISLHPVLPGNSVNCSVTTREIVHSGDIALSFLLDFLFLLIPVRQLRSLKLFNTRTCDHNEE